MKKSNINITNINVNTETKNKKIDYNTKINEIKKKFTNHDHDKCITTSEFNKLTVENFDARLAQTNLVTKTYFDTKQISLN